MNKQVSLHRLQNDVEELSEQLEDASKGLEEWREVALEVLAAMKRIEVMLNSQDYVSAYRAAYQINRKWPTE